MSALGSLIPRPHSQLFNVDLHETGEPGDEARHLDGSSRFRIG